MPMEGQVMTGFEMVPMEPIPAGENPYDHDHFNMGARIGSNLTVMFACFETQKCGYLTLVNTETGERVRILVR